MQEISTLGSALPARFKYHSDVSVKMVEGGGTKLIFAKNVLEKSVEAFLRYGDTPFFVGIEPIREANRGVRQRKILPRVNRRN